MIVRPANTSLRHAISAIWASEASTISRALVRNSGQPVLESVLPTGAMHLVIRIGGPPLRVYRDVEDREGQLVGSSLIGGIRERFYVKDLRESAATVGAMLLPGASWLLFGLPADELRNQHVPLDALWGEQAARWRDQLGACERLSDRLALWQRLLSEALQNSPYAVSITDKRNTAVELVRHAIEQWEKGHTVRSVVGQSGHSHRHFNALFRQMSGVNPKSFCRIARFQRALQQMHAGQLALCDIAYQQGYSDQAHLQREFQSFAGITPTQYRRQAPAFANHLILGQPVGSGG